MSGLALLYVRVSLPSPPCPEPLVALRPWTMDKDREAEVEAVAFAAGNPLIAITRGRIHLYRERTRAAPPPAPGPGLPLLPTGTPARPTDLLVMLAIPSHMSPSEVCSFAAAYSKTITHMRVLREDSHVRYMMVLRFSSSQGAEDFHRDMHGKPFNLLEPDFICRLAFVQEVVFDPPSRAPRNPSPLPLAGPAAQSSTPPSTTSTFKLPYSSSTALSTSTPPALLSSSGGTSSTSPTPNPSAPLSSSTNSTPPTPSQSTPPPPPPPPSSS